MNRNNTDDRDDFTKGAEEIADDVLGFGRELAEHLPPYSPRPSKEEQEEREE